MKKIVSVLLCLVLLLGLWVVPANAAADVTYTVTTDHQGPLYCGDEITFTVEIIGTAKVTQIGFNKPQFDTDVFEYVADDPDTDDDDAIVITITDALVSSADRVDGLVALWQKAKTLPGKLEIGKITLKVKAEAPEGATEVTALQVSAKNGGTTVESALQAATVSVAHTWDNGVVTLQPTCKDEGVKTYTCTACNATKTEAVEKTTNHSYGDWTKVDDAEHKHVCSVCSKEETAAHNWNSGVVTTPEDCGNDGVKTYTCVDCNATQTEVIPATGLHTAGAWEVVDNDTHKRVCTVCGGNEETAPHAWDNGVVTKEPTATEDGVRTFTCDDCSATKDEAFSVTYEIVADKDALKRGEEITYTIYISSSKALTNVDFSLGLDSSIFEIVSGDMLLGEDGTFSAESGFSVAFAEPQMVDGKVVLGTITVKVKEDAAFGNVTVNGDSVAQGDSGEQLKYVFAGVPTVKIECDVHTFLEWNKVDDAEHKGVCSVCGKEETVAHAWDNGVVTTPNDCGNDGVMTYTCVCDATKTEVIPATGEHTIGAWTKVDNDTHKRACTKCGQKVETAAHVWDNGVVTTPNNCGKDGVKTYTCECGATKTETVPATGAHKYDAGKVTTEATETKAGVKTYTCEVCGATKTEAIPATGVHAYGAWEKDDANNHKSVCAGCNDVKKAPHKWDAGKVTAEATATKAGQKVYTCADCGATKIEQIPATGTHVFGAWEKDDANNHKRVCSACNEVEKAAHKWDAGKVTAEATATKAGQKVYTCADCGATKIEQIPATGIHVFGAWEKDDANNHKHVCSVCNEVEKAAHKWDEGKVTVEATETKTGVKTYTCADCGATKTEEIAKTSPVTADAMNPALCMILMVLAFAGVAVVTIGKKKYCN